MYMHVCLLCACACMCPCICLCACACICMCVCVSLYICLYVYVCVCMHLYVCLCVCTRVCIQLCVPVCICMCLIVCVCVCLCVVADFLLMNDYSSPALASLTAIWFSFSHSHICPRDLENGLHWAAWKPCSWDWSMGGKSRCSGLCVLTSGCTSPAPRGARASCALSHLLIPFASFLFLCWGQWEAQRGRRVTSPPEVFPGTRYACAVGKLEIKVMLFVCGAAGAHR